MPSYNACIFWYGNATTRTFGRARRHRPYAFCLRELRADVRPYAFRLGGLGVGRLVSFEQIARGWLMLFGWIARKWLFGLCGVSWKNMMGMGRDGACVPARVALQGRIHR